MEVDHAAGRCQACRLLAMDKEFRDPAGGRPFHVCSRCRQRIPVYENMQGNGYESVLPDHYHNVTIENVPTTKAVMKELCRECYVDEYKAVYSTEPF